MARLGREIGRPEGEPVEVVYARLYREHFGRAPRFSDPVRMKPAFEKLQALCADGAIDPETYIAGNMWALQRWVKANPRIGFQPSHLSGENALRRYHAYLGNISRRLRHARHEGTHGHTNAGALRCDLFLGELDVGEEFVATYLLDRSKDLAAAVKRALPNSTWREVQAGRAPGYHRACSAFGTKQLAVEREFARLRAAYSIAERYRPGLSDRIGFTRFTWVSFARLIHRLVGGPKPRESFDFDDVPGVAWH